MFWNISLKALYSKTYFVIAYQDAENNLPTVSVKPYECEGLLEH